MPDAPTAPLPSPTPPWRRRIAIVALLVATVLVVRWSWRAVTLRDAALVQTAPLTTGPLESRFQATGEVAADISIFAPPDWGVVKSVDVREGDLVKRGQLLAQLGASGMRSRYVEARGAWTAARSRSIEALRQRELRQGQIESAIREAQADVRAAEARLQSAPSAVNRAELEKRQATLSGALEGRKEIALLDERLRAARADLALKTEEMHGASEQLRCEEMRAPSNGRVTQVFLKVGQRAGPSSPVVSMISSDPPWVEAWVAEQEACTVRAGQAVTLRVGALGGRTAKGRVTWVAPSLETPPRARGGERFLHIRVAFGDAKPSEATPGERAVPAGLRPGMAVDVDGRRVVADRVTLVPRGAIVSDGGGTAVFTVDGRRAHRTPVTLGQTTAEFAELVEGPAAGTRVVLVGAETLHDGEPVREQAW